MLDDKTQSDQLDQIREKEAEELAQILSTRYKIPYIDLSRVTIELDALAIVPEVEAKNSRVAVFQMNGKKINLAIQSPNPEETQNLLKKLARDGYNQTVYLASETSLEKAWKRYADLSKYKEASKGVIDISPEKVNEVLKSSKTLADLTNLINLASTDTKGRKVTELLEIILAGGIAVGASDIHIEPEETKVRLRYRLDGVLHDTSNISREIYPLVLSRLKLISGLKLNLRESAQDGRFSIKANDIEIEVRSSIIPESYGESVVLRILDPKSISVSFEDLGMEENVRNAVLKEITRPNGMILTTGPTGSGKTTTLYAFLKKVHNTDIKIITLEDPIEYHLDGITQTQVNKGKNYSFAEGLRSILRQDPDVIMVGEIRDKETAEIAVNASLTGHLVFSTLHTNDAAGAIPRLTDLGEKTSNLAPALNAIIAQRLLRKLCSNCRVMQASSEEEMAVINKVLEKLPKKYKKNISLPENGNYSVPKIVGCAECSGLGYKGRVGIYELIVVNDDLKNIIIQENPSALMIKEVWRKQEMLTMQEDAIIKVLNGITTIEEMRRVVDM